MSKKKPASDNDDFQVALIERLKRFKPRTEEAEKTYGSWEVSRSSTDVLSKIRFVLTTGITPFDDIVGGFPFGRITEIFGQEACGKTAMALRCAARARLGHICEITKDEAGNKVLRPLDPDSYRVGVLYIDNEQSIDQDEKIVFEGHELDIGIARTDTVAGVMRMTEQEICEAEEWAEKDPDRLFFTVVVVDTIASTSTKEDISAPWGKRDFPRVPAELSKGFSKLIRRVNSSNTAMICTNQVRVNYEAARAFAGKTVPVSYQYRSLGGMALKFYATHRVFMQPKTSKYKLSPGAQFPAGLNIEFHTVKNRIRMPGRDGRVVLLYDAQQGGYNDVFSLLESFILYHFIEITAKEKGTGFTVKFSKNGIVPKTFSADKVTTTLEEDDERPTMRRGPSRKDPSFKFRADWPAFYNEHKADIDLLWEKAVDYAFNTPGLSAPVVEDSEIIEDREDETGEL